MTIRQLFTRERFVDLFATKVFMGSLDKNLTVSLYFLLKALVFEL